MHCSKVIAWWRNIYFISIHDKQSSDKSSPSSMLFWQNASLKVILSKFGLTVLTELSAKHVTQSARFQLRPDYMSLRRQDTIESKSVLSNWKLCPLTRSRRCEFRPRQISHQNKGICAWQKEVSHFVKSLTSRLSSTDCWQWQEVNMIWQYILHIWNFMQSGKLALYELTKFLAFTTAICAGIVWDAWQSWRCAFKQVYRACHPKAI